jgi:hypothetical protein
MLRVLVVCRCCISMLHTHAACPCCYQCCKPMLHVHASWPCLFAAYPSCGSAKVLFEGLQLHIRNIVKGTVSRDFSCPVFFIKHLLLVPIGMPRADFKFFRIFVELFVFIIDSPVMNTPGSRLESFMFGNFCKHKSHVPRELK